MNIDFDINTFDYKNTKFYSYLFATKNSKDISSSDIISANSMVSRVDSIFAINEVLDDIVIARDIEKSIFEFSFVHIILNNLCMSLYAPIYYNKLDDIILNIDTNSYLNNTGLKTSILNGNIVPKLLAFLSPMQINPSSYDKIKDKIKHKEEAENTLGITDLYKCRKCGENKAKVTELQMRSLDEPTSLVITCIVCYNTRVI